MDEEVKIEGTDETAVDAPVAPVEGAEVDEVAPATEEAAPEEEAAA